MSIHRHAWISCAALLSYIGACDASNSQSGGTGGNLGGISIDNESSDDDDEASVTGDSFPSSTSRNGDWTTSTNSPEALVAIRGTSANDVWAVGGGNNVVHWNGSAWSLALSGTSGALRDVWGTSSSDIWTVGGSNDINAYGQILHWDGATWTVSVHQSKCDFNAIWGSSANDAWAVGEAWTAGAGRESCIFRWDGTTWKEYSDFFTLPLSAMAGTSANDIWAVGGNVSSNGVVVHWDGNAWTNMLQGSEVLALFGLTGVWANGPSDVWAVGGQSRAHWDGQTWKLEQCTAYASSLSAGTTLSTCPEGAYSVWGSSASDVWVVGGIAGSSGFVQHWNGSSWTLTENGMDGAIYGIWGSGPKDIWGAGSASAARGGVVFHRNN